MAYIVGGKRDGQWWPYDARRDGEVIAIAEPVSLNDVISRSPFVPEKMYDERETYRGMQWRSSDGRGWFLHHTSIAPEDALKTAIKRGYAK